MRRVLFVLTALSLFLGIPFVHGDDPDNNKKLQQLMHKKLVHSQKVLEGLALNDFDAIAANARDLIDISKAAEFRVFKSPQYEMHSNDFRRNADTLVQTAKAKNLDGAALAYVEMTLTCVRCHKHVREVRQARLD